MIRLEGRVRVFDNNGEFDMFYELIHLLSDNGFKQIKNATLDTFLDTRYLLKSDYMVYKPIEVAVTSSTVIVTLEVDNEWDKKYLQREVIPFRNDRIDNDKIILSTSGTVHINQDRIKDIKIDDLLNNIKTLKVMCKAQETKLKGINNTIKTIKECATVYDNEIKELNNMFDELIVMSQCIVRRGIRNRCCDDIALECLHQKSWNYSDKKRQSTYSLINEINYKVKDLINDLEVTKNQIHSDRIIYVNY